MRKNFRRIALGAAIAAGGVFGGAALALPVATSSDSGGVTAGGDSGYVGHIRQVVDSEVGSPTHGGGPVTVPGPARDIRPENYVNGAIQTAASTLDKVAQGLGGVHVGPLPAPTPGLHPENYANRGIQTAAATLDQVAQGLGGVHVGPLPAPTPGLLPVPETP